MSASRCLCADGDELDSGVDKALGVRVAEHPDAGSLRSPRSRRVCADHEPRAAPRGRVS
ncbi:MAG: hypothetical protein IPK80_16650 [Nannocystis sp.]|nr:hypothetical protein [Nannocystis sp.]